MTVDGQEDRGVAGMSNERLLQVLRAPLVSEKSARMQESANQYVFEVARDATKADVKKAVEELFNVSVKAVNVVNVKGKTKAFRGRLGRRGSMRKAYIAWRMASRSTSMAKA
jgi:large subunit ribosomal protein L23